MQHRPIAYAEARVRLRRIEDRADLLHREVSDQWVVMAFGGNGPDLPCLLESRRVTVLDVFHERPDGRQACVPRGRAVLALALDVVEEANDDRDIELLERELGGPYAQPLARVFEQEPERLRVAFTSVRTAALLDW